MHIYSLPSGPFETNCYVVDCSDNKAIIIDPLSRFIFQNLISLLAKHVLTPIAILLTHSHWDHIADVSKIKNEFPDAPIYIHPRDKDNLIAPGSDGLPCWIYIEGVNPDHLLHENEKIIFNHLECQVIETPGHTPGGVCFYFPNEHVIFTGDTLFQGTIGNLSFVTARPMRCGHPYKVKQTPSPDTRLPRTWPLYHNR